MNDQMNDQATNAEKGEKGKSSGLAKWSLALGIISIPILGQESSFRLLVIPVAVVAIACGVAALLRIRASSGAVKGKGLAIAGIILAALTGSNPVLLPLVATARSQARFQILEQAIRESGAETYTPAQGKNIIHYSADATETDAKNLGEALTELQLLAGNRSHDILLSKDSSGLTVSLVLPSASMYNGEAKNALPRIASALAVELGDSLRLRVVDVHLNELDSVQSSQ